jgi:hypothetical protein
MEDGCLLIFFLLLFFFVVIPNIWTLVGVAALFVLIKILFS